MKCVVSTDTYSLIGEDPDRLPDEADEEGEEEEEREVAALPPSQQSQPLESGFARGSSGTFVPIRGSTSGQRYKQSLFNLHSRMLKLLPNL